MFAVLTGLVGALSAKYLFALMRLPTSAEDWTVRGFALGIQVVTASLLLPLAYRLF